MSDNSSETSLQKQVKSQKSGATSGSDISVPIQRADKSMFDDAFVTMKQRFANEMRRIEKEMAQLSHSTDVERHNGETTAMQAGVTSLNDTEDKGPTKWEEITKSPLVNKDGEETVLNLQFDVSEFHPDEVTVKLLNNVLIVKAVHKQTTSYSKILKEFNKEFKLPEDTDAETIQPSIDNDGVLTVKVPIKAACTITTRESETIIIQ